MATLYVGTYTRESGGIHLVELNERSGEMTHRGVVGECRSPSFLAFSQDGRIIYAVNEIGDVHGATPGSVTAVLRDAASGHLTALNTVSSHGSYPCHITVSRNGKHVLVANYGSGTVAVIPITADGSLGNAVCVVQHAGSSVNKARQEGPHAHSINLDPLARFALACDLGTDQVIVYRYDEATGMLARDGKASAEPVRTAPGAGPRHLAFHPGGRFVYVINELDSTIGAYRYDPNTGALTLIETVTTLPAGFAGQSTTAEVVVHPSGKWVYGSNRGHDSIAVFAVNPASGALRPMGQVPSGGKTPRNFTVSRDGRRMVVANQDSNGIRLFTVNERTGIPTATEHAVSIPLPVCVRFAP